jgi:hypothetical protein
VHRVGCVTTAFGDERDLAVPYTIRDPKLERLLIALAELREEPRIELIRRWADRDMEQLRKDLKPSKP